MKIMICGGTGFLGYYTALCALKDGHEVASFSLDDVDLTGWYPKEIKVQHGDLFTMSEEELVELFKGYEAMIYAVGPDDRITPAKPSYDFFHQHLVEDASKVFRAARKAGVKKSVLFNSYFAYFDRVYPEKKLAVYHPYITARVEQYERIIAESNNGEMAVMTIELPYIFGHVTGREPIWKEVFIERFFKGKTVMFPKGGTSMIACEHVGEAAYGALIYGKHAERYPIGDENHTFLYMLETMQEGLGTNKKIKLVNKKLCAFGAQFIQKADEKKGLQPGLNMKHLMLDIMGDEMYIPEEITAKLSEELHFGRGGVKESIIDAMKVCYPEGFKK